MKAPSQLSSNHPIRTRKHRFWNVFYQAIYDPVIGPYLEAIANEPFDPGPSDEKGLRGLDGSGRRS